MIGNNRQRSQKKTAPHLSLSSKCFRAKALPNYLLREVEVKLKLLILSLLKKLGKFLREICILTYLVASFFV